MVHESTPGGDPMVSTLEIVLAVVGAIVVTLIGAVVWDRYFGRGDPHG
jgi:hypothetical protein